MFKKKFFLFLSAYTLSLSVFGQCPTRHDYTFSDNFGNFGSDTLILTELEERVSTRESLDERLQVIKKCSEESGLYISVWTGGVGEKSINAASSVAGSLYCRSTDHRNSVRPSTYDADVKIEHKKALEFRLAAYSCHQRAGWPSSIEAARQTVTVDSSINQPLIADAREERRRRLLENRQEKDGHDEVTLAQSAARAADVGNDRVNVVDVGNKCLRTVDVKQDSSVKGIHWYAIQNVCVDPIKAFWCDRQNCKVTNKASIIEPGNKEVSWTNVNSEGRHPSKLQGFACPITYGGATVYKDHKTNKCFTMKSLMR